MLWENRMRLAIVAVMLLLPISGMPQGSSPADGTRQATAVKEYTYKTTAQGDLKIYVHFPNGWTERDKRPAIVFFFGGAWRRVPSANSPTKLLYGTRDRLLKQGREFVARSKEQGNRAELFTAEGVGHGFFNRSPWREVTLSKADEFLASLGYLRGQPTLTVPTRQKMEQR